MLRQKRHKPVTISFIAGILQPNRRDNRGPQREDPFELNTTRRAPPKNYSVEERIQSEEELAHLPAVFNSLFWGRESVRVDHGLFSMRRSC